MAEISVLDYVSYNVLPQLESVSEITTWHSLFIMMTIYGINLHTTPVNLPMQCVFSNIMYDKTSINLVFSRIRLKTW